jgi:iron complex transport system substrate-binding protein
VRSILGGVIGACALVAIAVGCGSDEQPASVAMASTTAAGPAVVRSCGREVRVETPPRRAITMEQGATEILLSLGLADRMVGTAYQTDPPLPELQAAYDDVPVLAKLYPSRERVLEAEPDFVYSTYGSAFGDDAAGSREDLAGLRVPAYLSINGCEDPKLLPATVSFEQVFDEIRDLSRVFGVEEKGDALIAEQQRRLEAAREQAAGAADGETLLWWYSGTSKPYVGGCCGMINALSALVGAKSAFGDAKEKWIEGSWEAIAERDPSVIVLADLTRGGDGDSAESKRRFLRSNPVTKRLRAVREDRLVVVAGSETDPNVRSVLAAEKLAAGLVELKEGS